MSDDWIFEGHQDYLQIGYKINSRICEGRSKFQKVEVVETAGHGKMLLNDDLVMISERDEFVYHDMAAHVALFTHPKPQNVLVIGGGDGGTVREVIRHPEVKKCTLVEIDQLVVDSCREHIPLTAGALNDSRVEVLIQDGVEFLSCAEEGSCDVIIVDSTDPIGPAAPLFGTEFYQSVFKSLRTPGLVVSQAESPFYMADVQLAMLKVIHPIFDRTNIFNFTNLTYPGGLWSFAYASKGDLHPIDDFRQEKYEKLNLECRYYNQWIHKAAFMLPTFQVEYLKSVLSPIENR